MKILSSTLDEAHGQLVIVVHLDETKIRETGLYEEDGEGGMRAVTEPDPEWVADPYAWSTQPTTLPEGDEGAMPYADWLQSVLTETKLLAEAELARRRALLEAPTAADEPGVTELGLSF